MRLLDLPTDRWTLLPGSVTATRGLADHPAADPTVTEPIGALLARLRLDRGWSQQRLAERLRAVSGMPTVTRTEVSRWERGRRRPEVYWLRWLAEVLDVPLDELLFARAQTQAARIHARALARLRKVL